MSILHPRHLSRRKWLKVAGGMAALPLVLPSPLCAASSEHRYRQSTSPKAGFFANAYICEGRDSCILIDAHLTPDQAKSVALKIQEIRKPLAAIVITHPHPDHYLGLEHLGPMFPDAVIAGSYACLEVIKDAAFGWDGFDNSLRALQSGAVTFADIELECLILQDAESIGPIVLYDAATKTLVAGDHVLNGQHLWLAEDRIPAWQENLTDIAHSWEIEHVLPGHGDEGSRELITETKQYLEIFQQAKSKRLSKDEVRQIMLETFPNHVFVEALETSLAVHFTI